MTPAHIAYLVLVLTLALMGVLHLGAPLVALLFSYFALSKLLLLTKRKWLALILFILLVAGIGFCAAYFTRVAVKALPEAAEQSIPSASAWAEAREITLPFTDFESLKALLINYVKEEAHYLTNVARLAGNTGTALVFILIGIVAAVSLFFNSQLDLYRQSHPTKNNL